MRSGDDRIRLGCRQHLGFESSGYPRGSSGEKTLERESREEGREGEFCKNFKNHRGLVSVPYVRGIVQRLGIACQEFDEKINPTFVCAVNMKLEPAANQFSLAQRLQTEGSRCCSASRSRSNKICLLTSLKRTN